MEAEMKKELVIALFAITAVLLIPSVSLAAQGSITGVGGTAYYRAKNGTSWTTAAKRQGIDEGDSVKTGSDGRVEMKFNDGSKYTIGNDSEVEVTEFKIIRKEKREALFSLSSGKMRAKVAKFSGKSDIKVKTPTAVAGVKGTDFIIMNQGNANVVFGKEDTVEVKGEDGAIVKLTPDRMTENTRGADPIKPVKVEPGTPLADARAQLEAVTDVRAPVEWEQTGKLPMILARWNINYGSYLVESKKFKEALDVFRIAIDLTEDISLKAQAHLDRGTVYMFSLNDQANALAEYAIVLDKYPNTAMAENALYNSAKIMNDMGDKAKARELFRSYLERYPQGAKRSSVETMLKSLESAN